MSSCGSCLSSRVLAGAAAEAAALPQQTPEQPQPQEQAGEAAAEGAGLRRLEERLQKRRPPGPSLGGTDTRTRTHLEMNDRARLTHRYRDTDADRDVDKRTNTRSLGDSEQARWTDIHTRTQRDTHRHGTETRGSAHETHDWDIDMGPCHTCRYSLGWLRSPV